MQQVTLGWLVYDLTGVPWPFADPIGQSAVPVLVPKPALMNAVALNSVVFNMTKIIGPSTGVC